MSPQPPAPPIGLGPVDRALQALANNPERLERSRDRFHDSPPPYQSNHSHNSTASATSELDEDEMKQRDLADQAFKLANIESHKSGPMMQFKQQVAHEFSRRRDPKYSTIYGDEKLRKDAREEVKQRWIKQGIWEDEWSEKREPFGPWRHETPFDPDGDDNEDNGDTDNVPGAIFSFQKKKPNAKPITNGHVGQGQGHTERLRKHNLTRPFQQFNYLVCEESGRLLEKQRQAAGDKAPAPGDEPEVVMSDINTRAYETVRDTWTKAGIWQKSWGIMPGLAWQHEKCFDDYLREEMGEEDYALIPPEKLAKIADGLPRRLHPGEPVCQPDKEVIQERTPPAHEGSPADEAPIRIFQDDVFQDTTNPPPPNPHNYDSPFNNDGPFTYDGPFKDNASNDEINERNDTDPGAERQGAEGQGDEPSGHFRFLDRDQLDDENEEAELPKAAKQPGKGRKRAVAPADDVPLSPVPTKTKAVTKATKDTPRRRSGRVAARKEKEEAELEAATPPPAKRRRVAGKAATSKAAAGKAVAPPAPAEKKRRRAAAKPKAKTAATKKRQTKKKA